MLANMISIDPPADMPLLNWSEQIVSELPTGTVTLLLADVEGSTRLWETQSDTMAIALEQLNHAVNDLVARYGGVRPVEQGEGDSFVAAFARARQEVFEAAWSEGNALSTFEAIGYAQRGRGPRGRPASGWESLTPTERDVVRLVSEGLPNKDIAARLFVSPRTVQTHLTHVYAKLAVSSRVQLAQEAARHVDS